MCHEGIVTVHPVQIANCDAREVNLQAKDTYLFVFSRRFLNFDCPDVNLWLECDVRCGYVRVAEDVGDGGVQALKREGGAHGEYHQPGSSPGLCLGFSSISKSFKKDF